MPRLSDDTAKLLRATLEAAASPGANPVFQWPAPPYYEYAESGRPTIAGDCLLVFGDGAKASGTLLNFLPDEAVLKFQQEGAETGISIAFSSLLRVELCSPIEMTRQRLPSGMEQRVFAPSDSQPFIVQLSNGKTFQGDTVGYIEALCGLFFFLPDGSGDVVRHFIPSQAAREYTIGKPLGQMLVDQNIMSAEAVDAALRKQASLRSQRFGEYLTDSQIVSPEQLAAALKQQSAQPLQKLGESLVELGHLSPSDLEDALAIEQRNRSMPLGQILVDMGVVEAEVVNSVMAKKLGIPFVNLRLFEIPPEILKRIPHAAAYRYHMIPVGESENALVVAVDNPTDMTRMDEVRFIAGSKVIPVMASAGDIRDALKRHYGFLDQPGGSQAGAGRHGSNTELPPSRSSDPEVPVEELAARLVAESADLDLNERHAAQNDTTLVKLVNKIILDAVEQKASDIHIEANPGGKGTRVRFRKDGMMVTYLDMPAKFRRAVISRIKIMSQIDITERRRPQDGKIDFSRFGPAKVELRVATIPTANGLEDVVMRVLSATVPVPIDQIGFEPTMLATIRQLISRPHGLFLVCGPTGAGKTTTLHSLLSHLNTEGRKIWTAEDPIEITQEGLRQVQVNAKIGWTFAAAMRSFMRADPDIIMVGEMRDAETAKIGIEASLTGHLVLSTLHTNSAAESVVRLLDLGMDPFNFADALLGVLSQRLIRRLCQKCKSAYAPAVAELEELAAEYCGGPPDQARAFLQSWRQQRDGGPTELFRAQGCERCDGTGYKGRMGVYELLVAGSELKRLVQRRAPISEIGAVAMAGGMHSLKQDGIDKILQGLTDIHQVRAA